MLAFAAEHRFVLADHLARLLGISRDAAGTRMRALRAAGYLAEAQPLREEPPLYQVTTPGLRAIGSDLPRPRTVDLAVYRHDAGLAWLAVAAERGCSARSARSSPNGGCARRTGARTMGRRRSACASAAWGDGRQRLHYPDLVVTTATGHRVAFELELTTKEPRRRERILAAYAADPPDRRRRLPGRPPGSPAGDSGVGAARGDRRPGARRAGDARPPSTAGAGPAGRPADGAAADRRPGAR